MSDVAHLPGRYTPLGYKAAQVARRSGRPLPAGGIADSHSRPDRELLGRIAQEFDRGNGIYDGIVSRSVESIVGSGFTLQVKSQIDRLNSRIERDFRLWGKRPEVREIFDWQDIEYLTMRAAMNDGDVGVIKTNRLKLQYVESELICGGRRAIAATRNGGSIEQGVELDKLRRARAYWVARVDKHGWIDKARARRIRADDFILPAFRKRFSQTRGIPAAATTFSMINRINDVCDSEAIAWQLLSKFAITISRDNAKGIAYMESEEDEAEEKQSDADLTSRVMDFDSATIFHGEKGEKLSGIDRNLPGANFSESIRMFLRLAGMPLGLPLEIILLDYSKTNYSSARAALEQAYRMFVKWQRWLKRSHHNPVFEWWYESMRRQGFYEEAPEELEWEWIAPEFPWIDQLKEAKAWGERIDRGLATQTQALKSTGVDRDEWMAQRSREIETAIEKANEINEKYPGANVDWRNFAGIPASKFKTASEMGQGQASTGEEDEDE